MTVHLEFCTKHSFKVIINPSSSANCIFTKDPPTKQHYQSNSTKPLQLNAATHASRRWLGITSVMAAIYLHSYSYQLPNRWLRHMQAESFVLENYISILFICISMKLKKRRWKKKWKKIKPAGNSKGYKSKAEEMAYFRRAVYTSRWAWKNGAIPRYKANPIKTHRPALSAQLTKITSGEWRHMVYVKRLKAEKVLLIKTISRIKKTWI